MRSFLFSAVRLLAAVVVTGLGVASSAAESDALQQKACTLVAKGGAANYKEAARVMTQAAEAGDRVAQVRLSTYFRFGLGVDQDNDQADAWLERVVTQLNMKAALAGEYRPEDDLSWLKKVLAGDSCSPPDKDTAVKLGLAVRDPPKFKPLPKYDVELPEAAEPLNPIWRFTEPLNK